MKPIQKRFTGIFPLLGLFVLILDAKAALIGARDGLSLCIYSIVPSLFPFLVLSVLISSNTGGNGIRVLRPLGQLCGIPDGAEHLLVISMLGGYPVGAQAVTRQWQDGAISRQTAHRLLGFCSNAGPAFIFGMLGTYFSNPAVSWTIWLIHFGASVFVGCILPGKAKDFCRIAERKPVSMVQAMRTSLGVMAAICGWVIIFRVLVNTVGRWFLWLLPVPAQTLIIGLLELSNGCTSLPNIPQESLRFLLAVVLLSFGGVCVFMQTRSVTGSLGTGMYFPGKLLQGIISFLLASIAQHFLFRGSELFHLPLICYLGIFTAGCVLFLCLRHRKKVVALSA